MNIADALFPRLLGESAWRQLPGPVRRMHGSDACVLARGIANVEGDHNFALRALRRMLGLPHPATRQPLEVRIERHGSREIWTRHFASGRMQSILHHDAEATHLLERLGPVILRFKLCPDAQGVTWHLDGATMLGLPLPRRWLGTVLSHSGERDGRYAFTIDTRLPWLGRLVAYRGWLEIVSND